MAIIQSTTPPYIEDIIFELDALHHEENGYYLSETNPTEFAKTVAIEFAKFHVKAALLKASEDVCMKPMDTGFAVTTEIELCIDKNSILESYPLTLIK